MDALLFAVILEVSLLQMKILETGASHEISCDSQVARVAKQARDKLCRDRKIVTDLLKSTLIELAKNGEWCTIKHAVDTFKNNEIFLEVLKSSNDELKLSLQNIKAESQEKLHNHTFDLENSNINISLLRDRLKDCVYNTTVQLKYADKYLNARVESLTMELEIPPISAPSVDHEYCVHNELLRAYELQIKEKEDLLDYWQTKYVQDIAAINKRLKEQSEKYQMTAIRRKELEDLYTLHQGEIRGWLNFKRERAARLAREERARKAATRVQAWWRGVMVRRCYGAYRSLKTSKKGTSKPKKK